MISNQIALGIEKRFRRNERKSTAVDKLLENSLSPRLLNSLEHHHCIFQWSAHMREETRSSPPTPDAACDSHKTWS